MHIPVYGISKLWLEVRQLGRAIHFYRDVIRLPLVSVQDNMAFFDVDGQQIIVTEPRVFPDGSVAGVNSHWALAIDAKDEGWYSQKIRESGGNTYSVGFAHYIDDPDGNLGEFWKEHAWSHGRRGPLAGEEIAPVQALVEVSLMVTDSRAGLAFYRDQLGLTNLHELEDQGKPFMRARFAGGQDLLLWYPGLYMGIARAGRMMRLTLACESVQAVAQFLAERQLAYTCLADRLYFRDPFGHTFEVEAVAQWPLPPSAPPRQWSYPHRPTDTLE